MNHTEVIKTVLSNAGASQADVAKQIGAKSRAVVSERINHTNIGIKALLELLEAVGYEIVVREFSGEYKDGEYPIRLSDYE